MSDPPSETVAHDAGDSPRRRGRGLSTDRIARAALALIDEQGVGAASMRQIAARLGVEAMSLYKHVPTRDALLDAVVDIIVDELDADPEVRHHPDLGWRDYLTRLATGVRRYARAHPHAFPLVTTRPAQAPWINPPLRSLAWIEAVFRALEAEGFTEDQALFTYRSFNSFLLGYLLMETGAMTVTDLREGDGSFTAEQGVPPMPVPGGVTPTRTSAHGAAIDAAETFTERIDPQDDIDPQRFRLIHRYARRLAEEHFTQEFDLALADLLDRIGRQLS